MIQNNTGIYNDEYKFDHDKLLFISHCFDMKFNVDHVLLRKISFIWLDYADSISSLMIGHLEGISLSEITDFLNIDVRINCKIVNLKIEESIEEQMLSINTFLSKVDGLEDFYIYLSCENDIGKIILGQLEKQCGEKNITFSYTL